MNRPSSLSPEDQSRVNQVIHSGYNRTQRRPFRPGLLLFVLWLVVSLLGLVAWSITRHLGFS